MMQYTMLPMKVVNDMAKATKKKAGLLKRSFRYDGQRYWVYGHTQEDLFQKEKAKREELEAGYDTRHDPTFDQYYERWEKARTDVVKESSQRNESFHYKAVSNTVIDSAGRKFGQLKINDITVDDVRYLQDKLKKDAKGKERNTCTVNHYMSFLNHVMSDAVKERVIRNGYNPCVMVKPLKKTEEHIRDNKHRALTKEEVNTFLEGAEDSFYYDIFRFAFATGCRIGEISALQHKDISSGEIHIMRTVTKTSYGYVMGSDAKTKAGQRTIPINSTIKEILDHQKTINSMLDGKTVGMNDCIFKAVERGILRPEVCEREVKRICNKTGIEVFTMHACRATFATRAIESGLNPRTLQELMGHSRFEITMSLYGHVLDDTKKDAMELLEGIV